MNYLKTVASVLMLLISFQSFAAEAKKPNLLIIHTDEHNLRTLGCYRNTMSPEQAFMWGDKTVVTTPNIDALAESGAICTKFYAASPVCTPSRASFISGLYPIATGSDQNDNPLHDDVVTFAHILKKSGYATSYVGKWHLDGDAKPGFTPERRFGFDDNRYMFNRGHWKLLKEEGDSANIIGEFNPKKGFTAKYDIRDATEESFTTDFLISRAIEIIERDKDQPFAMMLSIPDPHGPNQVRAPYMSMFDGMTFETPRTMNVPGYVHPNWSQPDKNIKKGLKQQQMRQYYGMVKCIDDNVGRIVNYLKEKGLYENTIVVFTSDHGDLMGEHSKHNKGVPYEMSARIPFIIHYNGKVLAGKQINEVCSTIDFTPTILELMGVDNDLDFHGESFADKLLNDKISIDGDRVVYITNAYSRWVAAVDNRYKLVVSPTDKPWLFDLEKDPDEMINFYSDPSYSKIGKRMMRELKKQLKQYDDPALSLTGEGSELIFE